MTQTSAVCPRRGPQSQAPRRVVWAASAALAGALALAPAAPASADGTGGWWRDKMGIAELNAAGGTGKGITIAVIDGALNPNVPQLKGKNIPTVGFCAPGVGSTGIATSTDPGEAEHGTSIVNILVGNGAGGSPKGIAPQANVLYYADSQPAPTSRQLQCDDPQAPKVTGRDALDDALIEAMRQAVASGAKIISVSHGIQKNPFLENAVAQAQAQGVIVVAAASDRAFSGEGLPYPGVVQVGGLNEAGKVQYADIQQGDLVAPAIGLGTLGGASWAPTTSDGTSYATPIVAGGLAAIWSKHPTATANQVLQAAVRGTGLTKVGSTYRPAWRRTTTDDVSGNSKTAFGWGVFSPADAIKLKVTTLPDTNPFGELTPAAPTTTGTPTDSPTSATPAPTPTNAASTPTAPAESSDSGLIGGFIGAAIVFAIAGATVLFRRRSTAN